MKREKVIRKRIISVLVAAGVLSMGLLTGCGRSVEDSWLEPVAAQGVKNNEARYQQGKEDITGYNYEEWHIRYVGDVEAAREMAEQGLVLEEYLGR